MQIGRMRNRLGESNDSARTTQPAEVASSTISNASVLSTASTVGSVKHARQVGTVNDMGENDDDHKR
jgi:hypothetical protein